jgi:DNA gyrase subunit A
MGRVARGVRGTRLQGAEDRVVGMVVISGEGTIQVVTERGYGKRSPLDDYPVKGRGGLGVITVKNSPRNGPLVAIRRVSEDDELMIMTRNGVLIRLPVRDVSVIGRNTQGVRMVNLDEGDTVADVARLAPDAEESEGDGANGGNGANDEDGGAATNGADATGAGDAPDGDAEA